MMKRKLLSLLLSLTMLGSIIGSPVYADEVDTAAEVEQYETAVDDKTEENYEFTEDVEDSNNESIAPKDESNTQEPDIGEEESDVLLAIDVNEQEESNIFQMTNSWRRRHCQVRELPSLRISYIRRTNLLLSLQVL